MMMVEGNVSSVVIDTKPYAGEPLSELQTVVVDSQEFVFEDTMECARKVVLDTDLFTGRNYASFI